MTPKNRGQWIVMDTLDLLLNPATVANEGFKFRLGSPNPKSVMSSWWWRLHPGCGLDPIGNTFEAFVWSQISGFAFSLWRKTGRIAAPGGDFFLFGSCGMGDFLGDWLTSKGFDVDFFGGGDWPKFGVATFISGCWTKNRGGFPPNHPF